MLSRWRQHGSIAVSGRDHLHFRLLDMGFSQRTIVLGYYLFCLIFGLLALLISSRVYKLTALIVLGVSTLFLLWQLANIDPKLHRN